MAQLGARIRGIEEDGPQERLHFRHLAGAAVCRFYRRTVRFRLSAETFWLDRRAYLHGVGSNPTRQPFSNLAVNPAARANSQTAYGHVRRHDIHKCCASLMHVARSLPDAGYMLV